LEDAYNFQRMPKMQGSSILSEGENRKRCDHGNPELWNVGHK
jgi:hypothetical protein